MSNIKKLLMSGASGGGATYVDDLFSTYLYIGNGSSQTIVNGIDLAGEGGAVWLKCRNLGSDHTLQDTDRGANKTLIPNSSYLEETKTDRISSFNSDGFSIADASVVNGNNDEFVSWTFRKSPKFFDIQTWSGNSTAGRQIIHNLESVPGMIIVKCTSDSNADWTVYHRGYEQNVNPHLYKIKLNGTSGLYLTSTDDWNDTAPTSSYFEVGNNALVNEAGKNYVAYIFAHNDGDGIFGTNEDQDVIKCGYYVGTGGTGNSTTEQNGPVVDLGFEPQFLMIKDASYSSGYWWAFDTYRGLDHTFHGGGDAYLRWNANSNESNLSASYAYFKAMSTGFKATCGTGAFFNESNHVYLYMAISRTPITPPTSADEVFNLKTRNQDSTQPVGYYAGFPVDWTLAKQNSGAGSWNSYDRLRGNEVWRTDTTAAATGYGTSLQDNVIGFQTGTQSTNTGLQAYMWKRAEGFFDIVTYDGGSNPIPHKLGVTPEMIIVKERTSTSYAAIYHKATGLSKNNDLPGDYAAFSNPTFTAVNDTNFSGKTSYTNINYSGRDYVAYLFASVSGVCKVDSYTGNGTTQSIDCGFSNSPRFVLIKNVTSNSTDWVVFDSINGYSTTSDPFLELNTNNGTTTSGDRIGTTSNGFSLQSSNNEVNASGATYIYYAIA